MSGSSTPLAPNFPDALATKDAWLEPFEWYSEMRAEDPVRFDPARDVWDVFRYDEVRRVLSETDTFVSDPLTTMDDFDVPESAIENKPVILDTILASDPPQHTRLRSAASGFFTGEMVESIAPTIEEIADELLAEAASGGEFDLVEEFASPLTMRTIANLLGVPREDCDQFIEWSSTFIEAPVEWSDETAAGLQMRKMETQGELLSYFEQRVEEKRADPQDDFITALATGDDDLSERELLASCVFLIFAGHVTTTNLIANAIRCLDAHPDAYERLADGTLSLESTVEEVARYCSPQHVALRLANRDVELGDATIERGDALVAWIGSANRDARQFDDGDEFDPGRSTDGHLAFGHGPHYCLGAPLGRREATIALSTLLDRFDGLEVQPDGVEPTRSLFIYGVDSLPVTYA